MPRGNRRWGPGRREEVTLAIQGPIPKSANPNLPSQQLRWLQIVGFPGALRLRSRFPGSGRESPACMEEVGVPRERRAVQQKPQSPAPNRALLGPWGCPGRSGLGRASSKPPRPSDRGRPGPGARCRPAHSPRHGRAPAPPSWPGLGRLHRGAQGGTGERAQVTVTKQSRAAACQNKSPRASSGGDRASDKGARSSHLPTPHPGPAIVHPRSRSRARERRSAGGAWNGSDSAGDTPLQPSGSHTPGTHRPGFEVYRGLDTQTYTHTHSITHTYMLTWVPLERLGCLGCPVNNRVPPGRPHFPKRLQAELGRKLETWVSAGLESLPSGHLFSGTLRPPRVPERRGTQGTRGGENAKRVRQGKKARFPALPCPAHRCPEPRTEDGVQATRQA